MMRRINGLNLVGRTGDGKSTFGNLLLQHSEGSAQMPNVFGEGAGAASHTHEPKAQVTTNQAIGSFQIQDFAGLMDTGGVAQDEVNIRKIVEFIRPQGTTKAFILVINEQAPRFDAGMQDAVKLLYDSFGPLMMRNCAVVFTRAYGVRSPQYARRYLAEEVLPIMATRGMLSTRSMPCWQVNSRPEDLLMIGASQERVDQVHTQNRQTVLEILRWAAALDDLDVSGAVIGEYDDQRRIRENDQKMAEVEAQVIQARKEGDEAKAKTLEEHALRLQAEVDAANANVRAAQADAARAQAEAARASDNGSGFFGFLGQIVGLVVKAVL